MSKLMFTGDTSRCTYTSTMFPVGYAWLESLSIIGLDTETNVVESILNRQLKVVAISDESGENIWVIQWSVLPEEQRKALLEEIRTKLCVIQNVSFDYKMFAKESVLLEKVWDTMLAEQVLNNGLSYEKGYTGLAGIMQRRFNLTISKEEQLTFENEPYDDKQIQYAAIDVFKLGILRKIQISEMRAIDRDISQKGNRGLMKTMWWENEFVKVVADMEMTGVRINKEKWYEIEDAIRPVYDEELHNLNTILKKDFWDLLIENDWISEEDTFVTPIWSSAAKKKLILEKIYNFKVEKTAKTELKKLLEEHDPDFPEGLKLSGKAWNESSYPITFNSKYAVIKLLILGYKEYGDVLEQFLVSNLRDYCIEQEWLRPAGQLSLNWASPTQRLKVFQAVDPAIQSTGKDILVDYIDKHPIIQHYLSWGEVEYQLKNFGKGFYDNHVEIDGKHRTRYNQVLQTGRLSSVKPNLLNIPRKGDGVYRAAFIPDPGKVLIDADYDGQELVIVANLAKEKSWLEYLEKRYDLHSKNAELIFGDEWIDATEHGCKYYGSSEEENMVTAPHPYKKCSCEGHQEMRDNSKAVSFGSIYGISFIKLAFNLKISEDRAKFILKKFFEVCPGIAKMMNRFGNYAINNGHIIEPVFGRIRWFDKWKLAVPAEHGSIERAAFNTPIQSSGSALLKIAFVLLRRWINHNGYRKECQLLMPYHDETVAQSTPSLATLFSLKIEEYMQLSAKLAGFDIGASAKMGDSWLDVH